MAYLLPHNETFDWADKVLIELTTQMLASLFDFHWKYLRKFTYWLDFAVAENAYEDKEIKAARETTRRNRSLYAATSLSMIAAGLGGRGRPSTIISSRRKNSSSR